MTESGHYGVVMDLQCAVHRHRSWVPIEVHHIWPLGDGGPNQAANKVTVCANAHYSIHALLDYYARCRDHQVAPQWVFTRKFSPRIRHLADQGWAQIVAHKGGTR
jgi:hypothetical protein